MSSLLPEHSRTSVRTCVWSSRWILLTQKIRNKLLSIGVKVHDHLTPRFSWCYFCPVLPPCYIPATSILMELHFAVPSSTASHCFCLSCSPLPLLGEPLIDLWQHCPFPCEAFVSSVLAQHFVHSVTTHCSLKLFIFKELDGKLLKAETDSFLFPSEYLAQYLTSNWYLQK